MIDLKTARGLLPLVNSENYDDLMSYVDLRIDALRGQLENTVDTHVIYRLQGALNELRIMKRLRDTVNEIKKEQ